MYEPCRRAPQRVKLGDALEMRNRNSIRDCHSPGTECTNVQELKELRPTSTCTSTSNSAVYVRDRLASYVARARFCELAAASIAELALEWKSRASTSSIRSTDHMLH